MAVLPFFGVGDGEDITYIVPAVGECGTRLVRIVAQTDKMLVINGNLCDAV